jgi:hypothetical protein
MDDRDDDRTGFGAGSPDAGPGASALDPAGARLRRGAASTASLRKPRRGRVQRRKRGLLLDPAPKKAASGLLEACVDW